MQPLASTALGVPGGGLVPFNSNEFGHWGRTVSEKILPLQAHRAQPGSGFHGQALIARFHDSVVADIRASAHRVIRTRELALEDRLRFFKVIWQLGGCMQLEQQGRAVTVDAGHWVTYDTSRPYDIETSDDAHFLVLLLPFEAMGHTGLDLERMVGCPMPTQGTAAVARASLSSLLSEGIDLSHEPEGQRVMQESILALVGAAVRQLRLPGEAEHRAIHRKLQVALAYIKSHLTEPLLSADQVAQACGMSRRSLYTAFNALAQTPHAYIMRSRLALACELLAAADSKRTITQVAYELGFADAAHFSRAFNERYGTPPSQWRSRQFDCA